MTKTYTSLLLVDITKDKPSNYCDRGLIWLELRLRSGLGNGRSRFDLLRVGNAIGLLGVKIGDRYTIQFSKNITESARIGSTESSDGSILVERSLLLRANLQSLPRSSQPKIYRCCQSLRNFINLDQCII